MGPHVALFHTDLAELGLPETLLARVERARCDEMPDGGAERSPIVPTLPTLLTLAIDNAVEGCVRGAYRALVAAYHAANETVAEHRPALEARARAERVRAALAHDLAAWFASRLSLREMALVTLAQQQAFEELAFAETRGEPTALPDRVARALVSELRFTLRPLPSAA